MKALVSGGAGFIGSNLALELEKKCYETVVVDSLFSGTKSNLKGFKGEFMKQDVSEKSVKSDLNEKFDIIFHHAAITDPRYEGDDDLYAKNVQGFKNMVELAQKNNAKLIYASSASVYGNGHVPMEEDQEKDPFSDYARSKLKMDEIASRYFGKMHIVGLRYFNVFGPRESHKGRPASMIYHLRKQMLQGKNPRLFKYGEQKRDHIYVMDVVTANLLALKSRPGVYNIGTGIGTTFNDLVKTLNEVLKTKLEIEYFDNPYRSDYQENTQADMAKSEKMLGFKAQYSLKKGIAEYNQFLRKNEE